MMLFDDEDSFELDRFRDPRECVALPLKTNISLKDLWVPSELLPSRNTVLDSNRNQPVIFRTLEKTHFESLSVYNEDSDENLDNRKVLTDPLAYTGINNQNNASITDELDSPELYYSDNSDEHVNVSKNKFDNDKQITNFFRMSSRLQLYEKPCSNNVMQEPSITYQKSESDNIIQCGNFLDILNNEESLSSDSFDNCTNIAVAEFSVISQTPEKEDCDDNVQFIKLSQTMNTEKSSCGDSLVSSSNDVSDSAFQKSTYPICDNTLQLENLDTVNTKQPLCSVITKSPSEVAPGFSNASEKPLNGCDNTQQLLDAEKTEELSFVVEPENSQCEPVIELPIAYKRPVLEESRKKPRNQKKKEKKTAVKKNLQLGDFLQTANPEGYNDLPKKDEFYDNLVRQGICLPSEVSSRKEDYPSFKSEEVEFFHTSKNVRVREESFTLHQSSSEDLFEQSLLEEKKVQSDPVALSLVNKKPTTTLVLENISKEITKENIKSFVSGYGEVKKLSFEPCGKFLKVHVELILDTDDVDWLIECLNETEPFGASGGVVKCYNL